MQQRTHQQLLEMPLFGTFILSGSAVIAEAASYSGIDFLVIDEEGGPLGSASSLQVLQAVNARIPVFIRISAPRYENIEHALDLGAAGVIVPKINSACEVAELVQSFYYPPLGNRGLNPVRCSHYFSNLSDYLASANSRVSALFQIETKTALEEIEQLLAIPGLSGVFVGPGDLASALGTLGDVDSAPMRQARRTVAEAASRHQKMAGIFAYSEELACKHLEEGYQFIAIGNDLNLMLNGIRSSLQAAKASARKAL